MANGIKSYYVEHVELEGDEHRTEWTHHTDVDFPSDQDEYDRLLDVADPYEDVDGLATVRGIAHAALIVAVFWLAVAGTIATIALTGCSGGGGGPTGAAAANPPAAASPLAATTPTCPPGSAPGSQYPSCPVADLFTYTDNAGTYTFTWKSTKPCTVEGTIQEGPQAGFLTELSLPVLAGTAEYAPLELMGFALVCENGQLDPVSGAPQLILDTDAPGNPIFLGGT